jgi:hypothetical protein
MHAISDMDHPSRCTSCDKALVLWAIRTCPCICFEDLFDVRGWEMLQPNKSSGKVEIYLMCS